MISNNFFNELRLYNMTVLHPDNVNFEIIKSGLQAMSDHYDYNFYLLDNESMIVEDDSGFKLEVLLYEDNNIVSMKCSSVAYETNSIQHAYLVCNHLNKNTPFIRFSSFEVPKMSSSYGDTEIIIKTSYDTFYDKGLHIEQFLYNANYFLESSKELVNKNF